MFALVYFLFSRVERIGSHPVPVDISGIKYRIGYFSIMTLFFYSSSEYLILMGFIQKLYLKDSQENKQNLSIMQIQGLSVQSTSFVIISVTPLPCNIGLIKQKMCLTNMRPSLLHNIFDKL